jgi:hypothetical protein
MKRLSALTMTFAFLSLAFIILITFLKPMFPNYPLMSLQDVVDPITPLILIPIYWLLFKASTSGKASLIDEIVFLVLAGIWVEGHGIHLAANSIDNLIDASTRNGVINIKQTDIRALAYFLDEHLGHIIWHIGMLSLASFLIFRECRQPADVTTSWPAAIISAIIYGFTCVCFFIEGQTVALGLPFSILVVLFTLIYQRKNLGKRPVLAFFFCACVFTFILLAGWGLYWGGFPQFTDVGLI